MTTPIGKKPGRALLRCTECGAEWVSSRGTQEEVADDSWNHVLWKHPGTNPETAIVFV